MQAKTTSCPYGKRLVAFFIDWYVSTFFAAFPVYLLRSVNAKELQVSNEMSNLSGSQALAATLMALVIYMFYFCIFPLLYRGEGRTLGRRMLKLTIVKTDGSPLNFRDLFLRDFVGVLLLQGSITSVNSYIWQTANKYFDLKILYVDLFYMATIAFSLVLLITKRKQTLHDVLGKVRMLSG